MSKRRRVPRADRAGGRLRHPGEQRRHPARRPDRGVPGREVGRDHRDQPLLGLPHHRRRAADDAQGRLGQGGQHRLGPRPDRLALQVGLYRGQARHRRPDQDRSRWRPREEPITCNAICPGYVLTPLVEAQIPDTDEEIRHGPRDGDPRGHAGPPAVQGSSPRSSRSAAPRSSCARDAADADHRHDDQRRRRLDGALTRPPCPPGRLRESGSQRHMSGSTWRCRAAARTAPSPGACSTGCWRTRRSRSPAISGTSAGALNGAALKAGLAGAAAATGRPGEPRLALGAGRARSRDVRLPDWMAALAPVDQGMARGAGISRRPSPAFDASTPDDVALRLRADAAQPAGPDRGATVDFDEGLRATAGRELLRRRDQRAHRQDPGLRRRRDHRRAILASACLPTLFQAVEIDDPATGRIEAYWDGGYTGNPALFPLFEPDLPRRHRDREHQPARPRRAARDTPQEIQNRINEISFNSSLLRELRAIDFVQPPDRGRARSRPGTMKDVLVHMIADDALMNDLNVATKTLPNPVVLARLRAAGAGRRSGSWRRTGATWAGAGRWSWRRRSAEAGPRFGAVNAGAPRRWTVLADFLAPMTLAGQGDPIPTRSPPMPSTRTSPFFRRRRIRSPDRAGPAPRWRWPRHRAAGRLATRPTWPG